jgi:hypothetical protein
LLKIHDNGSGIPPAVLDNIRPTAQKSASLGCGRDSPSEWLDGYHIPQVWGVGDRQLAKTKQGLNCVKLQEYSQGPPEIQGVDEKRRQTMLLVTKTLQFC